MDLNVPSDGPRRPRKPAQTSITSFWSKFIERSPSRVTSVFPPSLYTDLLAPASKNAGTASSQSAAESYEVAAAECRERVAKIVKECHRRNEKFTDAEFDLEHDEGIWNCLHGLLHGDNGDSSSGPDADSLRETLSILLASGVLAEEVTSAALNLGALHRMLNTDRGRPNPLPESVHRVDYIFDDPQFCIDGYADSDVLQGANGDCWWLAAVAILCSVDGIIDRVCVAKDEECGVYGFVFFRDGEWIWTVIDDNLYLKEEDFRSEYDPEGKKEQKHKKQFQTGSDALFFSRSKDENETWLPLMEKAYAKIHGDYGAIEGGISGEAVEDMTGGVTSRIATNKILSKDKLWKELINENKEFLWAASSHGARFSGEKAANGIVFSHAFSILKAVEETGEDGNRVRLVKIRNPWGRRGWDGVGEYDGPWSDGSKEWTPYWMSKLDHTFGDDGIFWMSYPALLKRFRSINRTRLFNNEWHIVQKWTSVSVSWVTGYQKNKFIFKVTKGGPVVIVLSQLDTRYYRGLEGQYAFSLHFILRKVDGNNTEEIVRARDPDRYTLRSISAEIDLEPGDYEVIPKIQAYRDEGMPYIEDVVKKYAEQNPQKLRQIGVLHDIANAKGIKPEVLKKEGAVDVVMKDDAIVQDVTSKVKGIIETAEVSESAKKPAAEEAIVTARPADEPSPKAETIAATAQVKKEEASDIPILPSKPVDTSAADELKGTGPAAQPKTKSELQSDLKPDFVAEPQDITDLTTSTTINTGSESKEPERKTQEQSENPESSERASNDQKGESLQGINKSPKVPQDGAQFDNEECDNPKDGKGIRITIQEEPDAEDDGSEHNIESPWNAICVIGLRLYAKDPDITVDLAETKAEDGASLEVAEKTPAGATS